MKTKTITLYSFDELSEDAKKKAIDNLRDVNTDFEWWDFAYDDFKAFAALFGITLNEKRRNNPKSTLEPEIYFNGFYSQGSGSSFSASVDAVKFVNAIDTEIWKENYPKETLSFYAVTPNIRRICKLISSDAIDFHCWIETGRREASVNFKYEYTDIDQYRIGEAIEKELAYLLEDATNELNNWLYKNLETEYEYRSSDEAIIETIQANEWTFTEDGTLENE